MTPTNKQLVPIGPFPAGIDNRSEETDLATDKDGNVIAARALVNVDIDDKGKASTRKGRTKVYDGTNCHSGFYCKQFPWALFVEDNTLKAIRPDWNPVTIRAGLTPQATVSYAEINGEIYWSNDYENGRISRDLEDLPFGLEGPSGPPLVAVVTDQGGLAAGRYQVSATWQTTDSLGNPFEESGAPGATVITVPAGGGIACSAIPQPTDARATLVNLYVSEPDGDELRRGYTLPVGITEFTIGQGRRLNTLNTMLASPMPPGQIVRGYNGRSVVACEKYLRHSVPLHFGLTRLRMDFEQEPARITMAEPVGAADIAGIFVSSANRIWFLAGNFSPERAHIPRRRVHDFGAVFGTSCVAPGKWFDPTLTGDVIFFVDTAGTALIGLPDGSVRVVTRDYAAPEADFGSVMLREINGTRRILANMHGTKNKARSGDFVTARVVRNGLSQ